MSKNSVLLQELRGSHLTLHNKLYNIIFLFGVMGCLFNIFVSLYFGMPIWSTAASSAFLAALIVLWTIYVKNHHNFKVELILDVLVILVFSVLPAYYFYRGIAGLAMAACCTVSIAISMFIIRGKAGLCLSGFEAAILIVTAVLRFGAGSDSTKTAAHTLVFYIMCMVLVSASLTVLSKLIFSFFRKENHKAESAIYEMLRRLKIDPLTGIYNRSHLYSALEELTERISPLSIILFDIDHFKYINDDYGHQTGDQALIGVTELISKFCTGDEFAARYGGEEFVLVLPGSDEEDAVARAEAIRRAVESTDFLNFSEDENQITVSAGVAVYCKPLSVADFIGVADTNMYTAKSLGRNRVSSGKEVAPLGL